LNSFWRAIRVVPVILYTLSGTNSQESACGWYNVEDVVIKGKGDWLMEAPPQQVIPRLVAFINKSQ
jgi:hypothetical protein